MFDRFRVWGVGTKRQILSTEKQFIILVGKGSEGWNCRSGPLGVPATVRQQGDLSRYFRRQSFEGGPPKAQLPCAFLKRTGVCCRPR